MYLVSKKYMSGQVRRLVNTELGGKNVFTWVSKDHGIMKISVGRDSITGKAPSLVFAYLAHKILPPVADGLIPMEM